MLLKRFPILLILLLTGCASSPVDLTEMKSLPQDEGIIVGRVRVIEGGERKEIIVVVRRKQLQPDYFA